MPRNLTVISLGGPPATFTTSARIVAPDLWKVEAEFSPHESSPKAGDGAAPLEPGSFFSATRVIDSLRQRDQPPLLLPTRVRLERSEQRRVASALALPVIRDRACYGSLAGMGATLYSEGTGLGLEGARAEFDLVVERVLAHCGAKTGKAPPRKAA